MRTSSKSLGASTTGWRLLSVRAAALLLIVLLCNAGAFAYSVLTHEEIVDLLWTGEIRPLLLTRFPGLSEDQIRQAHAYAYGGAVIQDLGYYPFGSKEFSNLVHYVRSGDFVRELLIERQDVITPGHATVPNSAPIAYCRRFHVGLLVAASKLRFTMQDGV
jgi:hypothetical protein